MNPHNLPPQDDPNYKETWDLTGLYQYKSSVDNDAAWNSFISNKTQPHSTPALKVTRSYRTWISAAAAVVILAVGGFLVWSKIQQSDSVLTAGVKQTNANEIITETLEDGTTVTLNKNTQISWEFNGKNRCVTIHGMAHFEVARDESKPFIIKSNLGTVKVLGTGFDVIAYPGENQKVIVHHGKVELSSESKETAILTKNKKGIIHSNTNQITVETLQNANSIQWADGKLIFINTPIVDVIEAMEIFFNTKIEIVKNENDRFKENQTPKYTGKFVQGEDVVLACKIVSKALNTNILPANATLH